MYIKATLTMTTFPKMTWHITFLRPLKVVSGISRYLFVRVDLFYNKKCLKIQVLKQNQCAIWVRLTYYTNSKVWVSGSFYFPVWGYYKNWYWNILPVMNRIVSQLFTGRIWLLLEDHCDTVNVRKDKTNSVREMDWRLSFVNLFVNSFMYLNIALKDICIKCHIWFYA
jgi:hypothetical protein